ncbi:MAG TPA: hypothetical protein PLX06_07010, partial [Fimbriimonadaceae bacterium]|nr:hypothetical protein [Fimbriimonadaceae bacterium]
MIHDRFPSQAKTIQICGVFRREDELPAGSFCYQSFGRVSGHCCKPLNSRRTKIDFVVGADLDRLLTANVLVQLVGFRRLPGQGQNVLSRNGWTVDDVLLSIHADLVSAGGRNFLSLPRIDFDFNKLKFFFVFHCCSPMGRETTLHRYYTVFLQKWFLSGVFS